MGNYFGSFDFAMLLGYCDSPSGAGNETSNALRHFGG
jgi:hypothetical protein